VGGQLLVHGGHGFSLVLNPLLVEGVDEDLDVLLSVGVDSGVLASDSGRVYLIVIIYNKLTISSRVAWCTAIRVLLLGLFWDLWVIAARRLDHQCLPFFDWMFLTADTTVGQLNFFSRLSITSFWDFWKAWRDL
jgi:hypothetical protein